MNNEDGKSLESLKSSEEQPTQEEIIEDLTKTVNTLETIRELKDEELFRYKMLKTMEVMTLGLEAIAVQQQQVNQVLIEVLQKLQKTVDGLNSVSLQIFDHSKLVAAKVGIEV